MHDPHARERLGSTREENFVVYFEQPDEVEIARGRTFKFIIARNGFGHSTTLSRTELEHLRDAISVELLRTTPVEEDIVTEGAEDYNGDVISEIKASVAAGESIPRGSLQWHEFDHMGWGASVENCKQCTALRATYGTDIYDEK